MKLKGGREELYAAIFAREPYQSHHPTKHKTDLNLISVKHQDKLYIRDRELGCDECYIHLRNIYLGGKA
jgi:hypothetical protein